MSNDPQSSQPGEMSFLDHLEVLRWHLVRSFIALGTFTILAFLFKSVVFDGIVLRMKDSDFWTYRMFCKLSGYLGLGDKLCFDDMSFELINVNISGQFTMHLLVSVIAGLIVTFPYLFYEMWLFVKPALKPDEKKSARGVVFSASILFMSGVLFGYFMIAPLSVQFLGNYQVSEMVTNKIALGSFITTISTITLACGVIFQLPLVIYFLTKMGIVTPQFLKTYRKHAIVVVLILAAIITPPDISSQLLVTGPLMLLYELSIMISKAVIKREAEKEKS